MELEKAKAKVIDNKVNSKKKVVLSGMQSSGNLTLGNYLGAIKNWVRFQEDENYIRYYMMADLHSLTVDRKPEELRKNKKNLLALYVACGLDPKKNHIFVQSEVPAHSEVTWILNCITYVGELGRMTQFKDKSRKNEENINAGLLTYPVLMAADILIYDSDLIPVGDDQKQHIEIARDIARRFNSKYGNTFIVPGEYTQKEETKVKARYMGLQDPTKKMSKSGDNPLDVIYVLDSDEEIDKKIKRAVTDSEGKVYYDEKNKPGVSNLLNIYASIKDIDINDAEDIFKDANYGSFKLEVAKALKEELSPIRKKYEEIINDEEKIFEITKEGNEFANRVANAKKEEIYRKVGLK